MGLLPHGETGGDLLVTALDAVGVDAEWVVWDDETVDWAADLVAVRSTWDYQRRCSEFLDWAWRVERIAPLLNGSRAFTWNVDKAYLVELADHVPVVPTRLIDESTLVEGLTAGVAEHGSVVIKPRTGAGGVGVVVADRVQDDRLEGLVPAPWVIQPLVESVRTTGETSVYVLDGRAVAQVDKRPAALDVRVQGIYGGTARPVTLGERTAGLAESAVRAAAQILDVDLAYARVDMMVWDGVWAVSELELVEPGLYLDVDPDNATRFADLVASRLGRGGGGRPGRHRR